MLFSSRRRHTRYWRDWSSDVCSSDLGHVGIGLVIDAQSGRFVSAYGELVVSHRATCRKQRFGFFQLIAYVEQDFLAGAQLACIEGKAESYGLRLSKPYDSAFPSMHSLLA